MDSAQWSAKQTATGFSVSFFWPRQCAQYGPKSGGHAGRRRKRKRKGLKRNSGTTALTSDAAAANPIGSAAKRETGSPINAPQADQNPVLVSASPVELQPADHSDSNTSMCSPPLVDHSDCDGESLEQAVDLNACTAVEYEEKDDAHGVRFICDEKEGWTPVIGKRSRHKVPTRLLRLRAPPHVRASLPSSDSSASGAETSDSDCSLHIPAGADIQYSPHSGKPGLRVTTKSTSSWTPISSRTRSKFK